MTLKSNGWEDQTNGTTATVANSAVSGNALSVVSAGSGGAITYTTSQKMHGAVGLNCNQATAANSCYVAMDDSSATSFSVRFYLQLSALPSAELQFPCGVRSSTDTNILQLQVTAAGLIRVVVSGGGSVLGTVAMSTGTWYRIAWTGSGLNGASGTQTCVLYAGDSLTPTDTITQSGFTTAAGTTRIRYGKGSTATLGDWQIDDIVQDLGSSTEIGPAPLTFTVDETVNIDDTELEEQRTISLTIDEEISIPESFTKDLQLGVPPTTAPGVGAYGVRVDWYGDGDFGLGIKLAASAQSTTFSIDNTYLTCTDADATDLSLGQDVQIFRGDGVTLKYDAVFQISTMLSAAGFTNIYVVPSFPTGIEPGDLMFAVDTYSPSVIGTDVTPRLTDDGITIQYGKDTGRALAPTAPAQASFTLDNYSGDYSPENTGSPLYGYLTAGRPVRISASHRGVGYTLYRGYTDPFKPTYNAAGSTLEFSCLDDLAVLKELKLSTPVYSGLRTGDAIGLILDAINWPLEARDIDPGATVVRWWWEEGTDAFTAITKLVQSEGLPAFFTLSAQGHFIFRDRHHRVYRSQSNTVQTTFRQIGAEPRVSWPYDYDAGWSDIINSISLTVDYRGPDSYPTEVWKTEDTFTLADGETQTITVLPSDPFILAQTPVEDTDYVVQSGAAVVAISRDSGASTDISITATGATVVAGMALRANALPVQSSKTISATDSTSVNRYGVKSGESAVEAPWCGEYDALAVILTVLAHRAERLPIYTILVTNNSEANMVEMLTRDLSDRVHVTLDSAYVDSDAYIERIEHTIRGHFQIHETKFFLERARDLSANVFRFDSADFGFDDGVFATSGQDDPTTIFTFDDSARGFDLGVFAT